MRQEMHNCRWSLTRIDGYARGKVVACVRPGGALHEAEVVTGGAVFCLWPGNARRREAVCERLIDACSSEGDS